MKKNIVFGMLVSLLAIPTYTQAQEAATENGSASAEAAQPAAEKQQKASLNVHYSKGSVFTVGFGAGCSGMIASGDNVLSEMTYPTYNVSLRYSYYFFKFMAFTTGAELSTYAANLQLQGVLNHWNGVTTTGVPYKPTINFAENAPLRSQWSEVENLSMVEVPIALTFRAKPNKVGFLGTLGLKVGFPVMANYKYNGTINIYNRFPELDGQEQDGAHVFLNGEYQSEAIKYNSKVLSKVNGGVFGEVGLIFQVHPRVDMSLSAYANYYFTNVNGVASTELETLGFGMADNDLAKMDAKGYQMNQYKGLIGTNVVNRLNPFNCGVKLALHINSREKTDEQIAAEAYIEPDVVYVYDTVNKITVQVVHDTIIKEVRIPVDPVEEAPEKSYIYYRVGDSSHPVFEPADMLDKLAQQLLSDPSASIILAGHSSPEGNPIYNEILAQKRADTIARMLMEKGVKKEQLVVRSYGSEQPSDVSGKESLVKDRRVEVIPNSK